MSTRALSRGPASVVVEARTFEAILTSETPVRTWNPAPSPERDWIEVDEVLLTAGVDLSRARGMPLLDSHCSWGIEHHLGQVDSIRAEVVAGIGECLVIGARVKARDPVTTIKRMCAKRMSFLRSLATFSVFGKGWTARVVGTAGVEAMSVAMASAAPQARAAEEARLAANLAAAQRASAAASGAGAGGSATQVDPSALDAVSSVALVGVTAALVLLVVFLIARSRINRARADAHAAVAEGALS